MHRHFCEFHQQRMHRTFDGYRLLSAVYGLFVLLVIACVTIPVDCEIATDLTNSTSFNENLNYNHATSDLLHMNSIDKVELRKINIGTDIKNRYCDCPPEVRFATSNNDKFNRTQCRYRIDQEIKYACKSGYYKTSGSDKLRCVINGNKAEWDGEPLHCKIISCPDPGEVANATRIVKDFNFSYNSQVSYQCNTNFMSDSKPVILCGRNGKWNRNKPVCKLIQCPLLTRNHPKLSIVYTDQQREVNSTASFQCESGYHLDDETASRQCEWNGNWTGSNPTCLPNYCEMPETRNPDLIILPLQDRYNPDEIISFKCKWSKKYTMTQCNIDGYFTVPLPTECPKPKKTGCPPVEVQHGVVNNSAQDEFIFGARLSFKCHENYISNEIGKEIYCLHTGEWSSSPPRCLDLATVRTSQILNYILTCIIIILVLIITITVVLLFRWRQKQLQKRQWQRYFCNLEYQHCDKTKVQNNSSQEMHIFQAQRISVPFTDL